MTGLVTADGAVTGVGSLPLADVEEAVRFVAAHTPEVPFWPQLPAAGEGMLRPPQGHPGAAFEPQVATAARHQTEALREQGLPVIVVVDEPVLGTEPISRGDLERLATVLQAIVDAGGIAGLHTCAHGPLPDLRVLPLGLLSVDLTGPVRTPGIWDGPWDLVAAGVIPTAGTPDPGSAFADWSRHLPPGRPAGQVARHTLVTATCGLAGTTPYAAAAPSPSRRRSPTASAARPHPVVEPGPHEVFDAPNGWN